MGDFDFVKTIIQMIFALGVILAMIFAMYKITSGKVDNLNKSKYIKVLERTQISKDTSICVVKIGNKAHVLSISHGKTDVIQELTEEEVNLLEEKKIEEQKRAQDFYQGMFKDGKSLLKKFRKKDGNKGRTI